MEGSMKIAVSACLLLLCGCVSYSNTLLRNKDGKTVVCGGSFAFGVVTPVAMAMHHDCIKKANDAGYYEIGQPIPPEKPAK
jgi:hypothetical protein